MFNKNETLYKNALEKYVGKHVLDLIDKNKEKQLSPKGEVKNLTVSFTNIISYSMFSTKFTPEFMIQLLYAYYDAVFYGIEKNDGVVVNINGDEIISFFGYDYQNHEINAVKSYFDSVKKFDSFMQANNLGQANVIGNGINSGEVVIGNFGSSNRLFYSLMGDHVSLANQLVNKNRLYNTNLITSDFSYKKIKDEVVARELDKINVKGLQVPLMIYEVISLK